ncbi:DUF3221 domain-containing protein [Domibacillus sp. DTU_2020_1001157_1_SI_ALB_TIR_016]|uniref:DUF3221 domain-containing protein n=1 Tax=Domibacillus sp. DTU_2020_1001157_1_SI_ALB_TIR_016 TaxID=3077789 RepID=UPI0028ECA34D|nr:DUF3221 domain-containing protein [Domibacillus sp. DTU_2020_1001157_1_SI_ALB_TIR_016]WNS82277.1 DUF3221 domain-containing protein [Domibacillus sp. DTU_2020_1001157_1_SI_ALB_TIR_016]
MKKIVLVLILGTLLVGCRDEVSSVPEEPKKQEQTSEQEKNVFVELEQTTDDTTIRDAAYEKVLHDKTLTGGYLGKVTPELKEDYGVQSIEFYAVTDAIQSIYGNFYEYGILYLKNQESGAKESGVWVGIKNPDDKAEELARRLQKQVDEGKILAKYIHLFESEYSDQDNQDLMYEVSKAIKPMKDAMPEPERVALSISVDTITRTIEIGHDFLTDEQIEKLREKFSDHEMDFTQEGRMLPLPEEPDVEYPEEPVSHKQTKEGSWVMEVSEDSMLIVGSKAYDFSGTGEQEHYDATYYSFPKANVKLKVGQRVIVEASGPIAESYPGQGSAKFVTVLPAYQPKGADLTEEEVVRKAIEQRKENSHVEGIHKITYNKEIDEWILTFVGSMGPEPVVTDITIADQK